MLRQIDKQKYSPFHKKKTAAVRHKPQCRWKNTGNQQTTRLTSLSGKYYQHHRVKKVMEPKNDGDYTQVDNVLPYHTQRDITTNVHTPSLKVPTFSDFHQTLMWLTDSE
jgi:hypothetical protein